MFGRNDIVELLVDNGADKNIVDTRGMSVFALAAQQGNEEAIKILNEKKAVSSAAL